MRFTGVLCELVLIGTLFYCLRDLQVLEVFKEKMYWNVGYGIIIVASSAGALRFAGLPFMVPVHELLSRVGETIGITGVILGSLASLQVDLKHEQADMFAFSVAAIVLTLTLQTGMQELVKLIHLPAMIFLAYHAYLLFAVLPKAKFVLGAIALLASVDVVQGPVSSLLRIEPVDVFHIIFSGAIYCFTQAAVTK